MGLRMRGGDSAATGNEGGEGVVWRGGDGGAAFSGSRGRVGEAFAAGESAVCAGWSTSLSSVLCLLSFVLCRLVSFCGS